MRGLFDYFIDYFPVSSARLHPTAKIVHDRAFESSAVKVQLGEKSALSRSDQLVFRGVERSCSTIASEC